LSGKIAIILLSVPSHHQYVPVGIRRFIKH